MTEFEERKARYEIVKLARAVWDYEEWFVWFTAAGSVSIQPTGYQRSPVTWSTLQDCLDDLRARKILRFTNLEGHT